MQSTKQQQILGYFIEEAKEHLDTIEHGLLDLRATMTDPEQVNELFRAAHSVKGGAAMLGFESIQKTAHHFEDCFKILKEKPVPIDRTLEDLFLKGFDTLKELVEGLQGPFGLRPEDADQAFQAAEPTFTQLQNYLAQLLKGGAPVASSTAVPQPARSAPPPSRAAVAGDFLPQATAVLKEMLLRFKQGDSTSNRQQLAALCGRLLQLNVGLEPWQAVVKAAQAAIANPQASYQVLAPLVIKELKQATDLLVAGRATEVTPSQALLQLAKPAVKPTPAKPAPATPAPTPPPPTREAVSTAKFQQVTIPVEPRAAAKILLETFNKEQLIEIAEFLMKAIQ